MSSTNASPKHISTKEQIDQVEKKIHLILKDANCTKEDLDNLQISLNKWKTYLAHQPGPDPNTGRIINLLVLVEKKWRALDRIANRKRKSSAGCQRWS